MKIVDCILIFLSITLNLAYFDTAQADVITYSDLDVGFALPEGVYNPDCEECQFLTWFVLEGPRAELYSLLTDQIGILPWGIVGTSNFNMKNSPGRCSSGQAHEVDTYLRGRSDKVDNVVVVAPEAFTKCATVAALDYLEGAYYLLWRGPTVVGNATCIESTPNKYCKIDMYSDDGRYRLSISPVSFGQLDFVVRNLNLIVSKNFPKLLSERLLGVGLSSLASSKNN